MELRATVKKNLDFISKESGDVIMGLSNLSSKQLCQHQNQA